MFFSLEKAVFLCAPVPPLLWDFALRVILLLAMPEHAYMYHTTSKKGLLGTLYNGVSTHHLTENTTVEFSHFVRVHYPWKIWLPPDSSWQTGVTQLTPMSWPCFECYKSSTLDELMSWLKYYPLDIPMLSYFNEAKVIFVYVTQLKELIAGIKAKLQGSVFHHYAFLFHKFSRKVEFSIQAV